MSSHTAARILIADDHAMVRAALKALVQSQPGFIVVGEACDGAEAVAMTRALLPDVLLLDLAMPGVSGLDVLQELDATVNPCRIIVLTASIDEDRLVEALRLGARGIVKKISPTGVLFEGIRAVLAGEYWSGAQQPSKPAAPLPARANTNAPRTFGLTPREMQVVGAVVAGYSNKEIAQHFSITRDTTKHHLTNIFDKLGVCSRLELALFACHHRLVAEPASAEPQTTVDVEAERRDLLAYLERKRAG